jgi:hypothetical protein
MLSPGPENVSLLAHAGTVAGSPGNSGSGFPARQTGRFCVVELLLKLGISFAPLAVDPSPDWGIFTNTAEGGRRRSSG